VLEELHRFVGDLLRRHEPESVAVVGRNRVRYAAQKTRERQAGSNSERVPTGNIEPGKCHANEALDSDQAVTPGELRRNFQWRDAIAPHRVERVLQHPPDRRCSHRRVAEEIGAPSHALFRFEVNEEEWRRTDGLCACPERARHGQLDGRCANGTYCEKRCDHPSPFTWTIPVGVECQDVVDGPVDWRWNTSALCAFQNSRGRQAPPLEGNRLQKPKSFIPDDR
jgi:hypothetical protein